jgi:hypothetical protein
VDVLDLHDRPRGFDPFVVSGVDPLLLSLNLPAIRQDLGIPSDPVGFTGIIVLIIAVVPLVVAPLAYYLIPPRRQQTIQAATAGGQETETAQPRAVETLKENSPDADQSQRVRTGLWHWDRFAR